MEKIRELLRERAKSAGGYAPFWDFKSNPEFVGVVVARRPDPRAEERHLWDVRTLEGEDYTLPSYALLDRALEEQGAGPGKYIYVRFVGEAQRASKGGRRPFLFEVAVMGKEEAEELLRREARPGGGSPAHRPEEARPEAKKPEPRPPAKEERPAPRPEQLEKAKAIVSTLRQFYGELDRKRIEGVLKEQGIDVPLEEVCGALGLKIEGDRIRG